MLNIAKFPKAEETPAEDVCAWEGVALELASLCGMRVPATRLVRVAGRAVLLLGRFDRRGSSRVAYLSGMSAVQGQDGKSYSYLELVDFLEMEGSAPEQDVRELWLRVLFSCALGNTDDHLRNHGFLRDAGGWRLCPLFDVNPTQGDGEKYLSTAIDLDRRDAAPSAALDCCELFRVSRAEGRRSARKMADVLEGWRKLALRHGISTASAEGMRTCFESGIRRLRAAARG